MNVERRDDDGAPELVAAFGSVVGEGPVWDGRVGRVAWVDIIEGRLYLTARDGETRTIQLPSEVGSIALRASGGWVAALADGFWAIDDDGAVERLADVQSDRPDLRFNDGKCDPQGRFLGGHDGARPPGGCRGALPSRSGPERPSDGRGHLDLERARLEPRRPDDVLRRHADPPDRPVRFRPGDRIDLRPAPIRGRGSCRRQPRRPDRRCRRGRVARAVGWLDRPPLPAGRLGRPRGPAARLGGDLPSLRRSRPRRALHHLGLGAAERGSARRRTTGRRAVPRPTGRPRPTTTPFAG